MIYVRIPRDRIGVLIGHKGETRKMLEERSGLSIEVDTDDNEVMIHDEVEGVDPLMVLKMRDIIKAIGRGFSPQRAMRLFSDEAYFELLDIHDYVGKHKNHIRRVTARLIGSEGKTRKLIEEHTGCELTVYGHTVGLIGDLENLGHAKQACDMLLNGAEHASVYRFLEAQRRAARKSRQELW